MLSFETVKPQEEIIRETFHDIVMSEYVLDKISKA